MEEISWRQMIIPVIIFIIAITVQLLALLSLFVSIPQYESIPHLDAIAFLLNLVSWLLIVLLAVSVYGFFEEANIYCSLATHFKIDFMLVVIGIGALILGSMNIKLLEVVGVVCITIAVGDVVYLGVSHTGTNLSRRL